MANSTLEHNGPGGDTSGRAGRGTTTPAIIFVRGAQPLLLNNIIQNNDTAPTELNEPLRQTAAISINVNALKATLVTDYGRSTGLADVLVRTLTNSGPLVQGNRIGNTPVNGMIVRGGRLTTDVVWDDTDIVHVVLDEVQADTQFALSGRLLLESSATESLIIKLLGTTAGITASGVPLDINDRTGGAVQMIGMANHPIIMTSLFDTTVGAGFAPDGTPQNDTHNILGSSSQPTLSTNSGPVVIDGGDRDDHGFFDDDADENRDGWKFLEQSVNFAYSQSLNTAGTGVLVIGIDNDAQDDTRAEDAIESVADVLNLDLTYLFGADIASRDTASFRQFLSQFRMIYVPSDAFNTEGGITDADLDRLAARKFDIQNYVNTLGGGLVALTEDFAQNPYSWLELPQPFTIQTGFGVDLVQTPLLAAAGFNITDEELSAGTPWHNTFIGPPGYNRLQVWVVDPVSGQPVTLGIGAGQGGIGVRLADPQPGDWRSIKLDDFSNDRNVDILNEFEQRFAPTGDTNGLPTTAQFIGELAKDQKSGDDNRRLGFEIHGTISQTATGPKGGDVDVYSFRGTAGSVVWFDIDRTAQSLDTVVELIDANGAVVARSDNSNVEQNDPALLVGIAQPMRAGFVNNPGPFTNPDHYSTNGKDAGMRLVLPGTANSVNTYFVRVRASSSNLNQLNNGGSQGEYVLQIRLQNLDEFPGSTVRYADIRYAAIGIEVIGKPGQSPLLGDTASSNLPHNTFETAQDLGNLLTTDRNEITVAGNLANANDVVWFKMDLNYDLIQSIGGFSNGLKSFATMFNISYADGLTRPDTTISIFDQIGNLLLIGRDSQIPDTQPRETLGSDTTNTSHGSFGALDATVGSVQMPAGGPQPGTGPTPIGGTAGRTYYIAVSSSAQLPTVLDATFQMEATNPRVRLEPINSTKRLVDDRIGSTGDTTAAGSQQIFTGNSPVELNVAAVPYTLNDVVLYANTVTDLLTINPFTGKVQTFITDPFFTSSPGADPQEYFASASPGSDVGYFDIAMRDDGRLYTYRVGFGDNNTADTNGGYTQADPGDARTIDLREFAIETFVVSPDNPVNQDGTWAFVAPDEDAGVAFNAMTITRSTDVFNPLTDGRTSRFLYAVGNRNPGGTIQFNGQTVAPITEFQNLLFRLDPDTGLPFDTDLITNEDAFPRPDDVTFIAWQPYAQGSPSPLYPTDILAGSGTVVVPRGTLRTGVFLVTVDATNTDPAALFATSVEGVPIDDLDLNDDETIEVSGVPVTFEGGWELRLRNANAATLIPDGLTFDISGRRFEMDSNGVFNGANVRVQFNASDSVDALLEKMTVAVNGAAISNLGQTVVASHARDRILFLNPANNTTNLTQFTNLSPTFTVSGRTGAAGVVVKFLATDTADDLASKIASAITNGIPDVNPNNPGTPITVPNWGINITATNLGNGIVQLNAGVFDAETGSLDSPFESDAPEVVNLGQFFDAVGDITGVAVLPQPSDVFFFDELMYTVSDTGGLYRVNNYFSDDRASLELLSLVHDPDGERAHFTGLTQGPGTVENGRYAQTLFAVDEKGNLYAFDSEGRPANIFVNGASVVSSGFGSQLTFGSIQGLAFSPLDYNLWHTTSTRGGDADRGEHGVNSSFDYDAARGVTTNGGNSFYFGLEDPRTIGGDYRQQPSTWAYIPFADQPLLSGNQALFGSYNLPGGAKGSLISGEFSLEGYAATDKPTLYFNYALDSEGANSKQSGMLDSFRVYASSDGVNWTPLATNNSVKSATFSTDAELPTYLSQSGGEYQNDKSNQRVQELFDPPGEEDETPNYPTNPFDEPLPTTAVEWRQARVDLGDLAGQSNIRLRFDFSTAGTMGTGNLLQGGVYLGAVAARDIKDGDQFTLDRTSEKPGTTFTFREGLSLVVPAGGGSVIGEGETFTVGTRTFEFTRDANVTGANVPVLITSAQTPQEVADSIFAAIVGSPIAGVTPVRDSGYSLQVSINGSVDLVNGETLTVNGRTFELRRAGDFGEPNIAVAYDSTLILEAPATGGFDLVNGETFTINDTTFELRSSGVFTPGNVPIQFNQLDSRVTVSTKIITAINNANIPNVDAVQFGTGIALLGATSATRSTLQSLRLFAEPDFGTTPADDVVALIRDAIAFADLGVSSVQTGNNLQLVGADSVTQSVAHSLLLALQTDGVRVQLLGATGVTQSSGASLIVEGSALGTLTNTDIFYQVNWTAEQVAQAVAIALDAALTINGGQDNPDVFTSSKRDGDRLQLFGHFVNDSGPLTTSNFLQGDQYGVYDAAYNPATGSYNMAARARGQNNEHQGVFIDDIIVGFAARGEMVTGHFDPTTRLFDDTIPVEPGVNTFTPAPTNPDFTDPQRVLAGPFQLNIRRGTEYGASSSGNTPFISLFQTFDVNDRLAQGLSLIVPAAAQLVDGQTFAITLVDGRTLTFEFDSNNALTNPNNFPVLIQEGDLATTVALRVRDAINNVPASFKFDVKASVKPEKDRVDVFGGVHIEAGPLTLLIFDNLGDATPIRTQGETIVANNRISNVQQAGIIVRPVLSASGESFSVGVPGRTASVINLPVLNGKGYVPGVAIKENLIVKGGQTGIVFSGSPTTDIAHSVPFGRILNNTIVQTPFGIQVVNNASPTLLNNVVAETGTAIRIDNSSASTVLGASVYQNNTTNLAAPGGFLQTDPIVLQPTAPLFVDSSKSNFYLQAASRAIDSSVNTLQDRPELTAVTNPLGIPASPIQASERDLLGQLRVDDVTVPSPPGLGSNVFKDRGALERADVLGPAARLLNPLDNDAGLIDKSQTVNKVIVVGRKLSNFEIQLVDAGVGVDDATVTAEKFVITRTVGGVTTTLVPDVDYSIDYQTTADIVLVTPTEGVWSNAIYNITLNNGTGGIADSLGNKLQPNETGGGTRFTIELTDTLTSPWQNPVNKFDVNGDGNIYPLDAVIVINNLLLGRAGTLPPVAQVPPYIDVNGDGILSPVDANQVITYLTLFGIQTGGATPLAAPQVAVVASADDTAAPADAAPAAMATSTADVADAVALPASSAVAFSLSLDTAELPAATFASSTFDVAPAPVATPVSPTAHAAYATGDDIWEAEDWDASADELDGIVADLFDDSEETDAAFA
ncbi:MAG: dockerin type I domain-containing protein [Pirellulales bacterium]